MHLAEAFSMPILVVLCAHEARFESLWQTATPKRAKLAPNRPPCLKLPKRTFCASKTKAGAKKKSGSSNLVNSRLAGRMGQNEAEQANTSRNWQNGFSA